MASSNLAGSYVSDRYKKPALIIGSSLAILAITTVLMVEVNNFMLLIGIIIINAFFIQLYFGPLFAAPVEILGTHMTGTATGFGNFFAKECLVSVSAGGNGWRIELPRTQP